MSIQTKHQALQMRLRDLGRVVVAYSGGVDSTFLLAAAVETLGRENVLACIGVSPSLARSQYAAAIQNAKLIGAEVVEVNVEEVHDADYAANKADRCFHCKSHLYGLLVSIAKEKGYDAVACGSNLDDKDDFRPGNRAAKVFGIACPLMEAGLTKAEIRELSRRMNLPTADVPASPCLASRMSYGLEITAERLRQVEKAEDLLRSLGFVEFRVRHHDAIARIEVRPADLPRLTAEPARTRIVEQLKSLGFKFITVDLQGFRSGALNEALSEQEKQENR